MVTIKERRAGFGRTGAKRLGGRLAILGRFLFAAFLVAQLPTAVATAQDAPSQIAIAYLRQEIERPPALSNLEQVPGDEGLAGARLGIDDNGITGRFTGKTFTLIEHRVEVDGDPVAALLAIAAQGHRFVVLDVTASALDAILARPEAAGMLLFNASVADDRFRVADCRPFLLHTLPSRAMLADALGQYLVKRTWTRWFLVTGPRPEDRLYAAAIRRAAGRFGARIVAEKTWTESHDARRTAQAEIPVLTQGPDHDVLIVADEIGDFGEYVPYRTWLPRPVAGTQGLSPRAWHWTVEQYGAAQLQSRFLKKAGRAMTDRDYAAWAAVRAVGEAGTRTPSVDFDRLRDFIRGPAFQLAGFKGQALSFRPWSGQLRQPIPVVAPRALVTLSPQEGFLHQVNELDSLGHDAPETTCKRT